MPPVQGQGRGLPPAHVSLPPALHRNNHPHLNNGGYSQGALTAQAVTAALANPYYRTSFSSHYAQAYAQYGAGPSTNTEGYTLSSTYVPTVTDHSSNPQTRSDYFGSMQGRGSGPNRGGLSQPQNTRSGLGNWSHYGNECCTYKTCTFTGSHKALETHKMDRHLIFPPGWDHKKNKSEWDADPSLKGKPIPIQGTNILLDDPEVLEAWIAERKRRWPSSSLVEEKKRKREDALARGQTSLDDPALLRGKRPRYEGSSRQQQQQQQVRQPRDQRGGGRGRVRGADSGWSGRGKVGILGTTTVTSHSAMLPLLASTHDSDTSSDDEDGPPETMSSKVASVPVKTVDIEMDRDAVETEGEEISDKATVTRPALPIKKAYPVQPKKIPYNPFASRPTLLRNLLLPEIRITVSNLSQAIRFLVANDFLQHVELKPGQAVERLIEVIEKDAAIDAVAKTLK